MSIIEVALKALDFHIYDRQGHELTLWRSPSDEDLSARAVAPGIPSTAQDSNMQTSPAPAPATFS
jgi:hypothetical protein